MQFTLDKGHFITGEEITMKMHEIRDLIVDMVLAGASSDELKRVIKYSISVIDAEKNK